MRTSRAIAHLAVLVLLTASCGGSGADEPSTSTATPSTPTSTAAPETTVPTTIPPTVAPTTTSAPTLPPLVDGPPLRGEGLGTFRFGAPSTEVLAWLEAQLGPPARRAELRPPLAADMGWFLGFETDADEIEWFAWRNGTAVAMADRSEFRDDGVPHLVWWSHGNDWGYGIGAPSDPGWTTPEGLVTGSVAAFRATYPDATTSPGPCDGWWLLEVPATSSAGAGLRAHVPAEPAGLDEVIWLDAGARPRCAFEEPPPAPSEGPVSDLLELRGDGIGEVRFGTPLPEARQRLEQVLGPPNQVYSELRVDPASFGPWNRSNCYAAQHESTLVSWTSPRLTVAFHDALIGTDDSDETVRFVLWHHQLGAGTALLSTATGAHPGITAGQLRGLHPDAELVAPRWFAGISRGEFVAFNVGGEVRAGLDWAVTLDVQRALQARGYTVELDGFMGELTRNAVAAFRAAEGLDVPGDSPCLDVCCELDAALLWALGLGVPPADAVVVSLSAGVPGSCDGGC